MLYPECSMPEVRKLPVVMLGAYFDEAGILPTDKVCVIAGFMGSASAMVRMAKDWNAILKKFELTKPFHSKEFYAPPEKLALSQKNPYRGWSNTKRKKFEAELISVMAHESVRIRCVAVDAVAFRGKSEAERRWLTGGRFKTFSPAKWRSHGKPATPYHYLLRTIIQLCAQDLKGREKIHFFMSHQDQYEGFALELYNSILNRTPPFDFREHIDESLTFETSERFAQLQAADFAAYHLRIIGESKKVGEELVPTGMHLKLVRMMKDEQDLKLITADVIDKHCERYVISLKETAEKAQKLKANRAKQRANLG